MSTVALLLLKKKKLLLLKKKRLQSIAKRPRSCWVHSINLLREEKGLYNNLIMELREPNATRQHRQYLRMSKEHFDHLLRLVAPHITKQDTFMRRAIHPGIKVAVTLHHLAEGASHNSIAMHYRLGRSTVSEIIYDTAKAIYDVLQPLYMKPPSGPEEWKRIANG